MLSERKRKILKAICERNIKVAEPISSKDLQEQYFNDVSSATIRNELMALEEMGYLSQPHISSGRIPTVSGFQKYIDEMLTEEELTDAEIREMKDNFNDKMENIEELAIRTAKVLSDTTNYASVVYLGELAEATIQDIKIVKLLRDTALVIIVTDLGVIKDITVSIEEQTTEEDCTFVSKMLISYLSGKTLAEVNDFKVGYDIGQALSKYKNVFENVLDAIKNRKEKSVMKFDGASKLLLHPEYQTVEKAQKALALFENKEILSPILSSGDDLEISIKVGGSGLEECSIVTATYSIGGKPIGKAGVIGPVRMDYSHVVSVLKGVNKQINKLMKKNAYKEKMNDARKNEDKQNGAK